MKQCILSESRFDFLKDLVKNIPDVSTQDDNDMSSSLDLSDYQQISEQSALVKNSSIQQKAQDKVGFTANFYTEQSTSKGPTVIQYGSGSKTNETSKIDFSIKSLVQKESDEPKIHIDLTNIIQEPCTDVPPLVPIARNNLYQSNTDNLCIDEDYDN